jgi:DNA-binding CsgD family transcriptional regulator
MCLAAGEAMGYLSRQNTALVAILAVGLGAVWSWRGFALSSTTHAINTWAMVLPSLGAPIAAGLCVLFHRRLEGIGLRFVGLAVSLLPCLFQVCSVLATSLNAGSYVFGFLQFLLSLFGAALIIVWGYAASLLKTHQMVLGVSGSFLIGALYCLTLSVLPEEHAFAASCLLPLISGIAYWALFWFMQPTSSERTFAKKEPHYGELLSKEAVVPAFAVLLAGVSEFLRAIFSTSRIAPASLGEFSTIAMLGGGLAVALLCAAVSLRHRPPAYNTVARYLPIVVVAGYLAILLFNSSHPFVAYSLMGMSYWCLRLFLWVAIEPLAQRSSLPTFRLYAVAELGMSSLTLLAQVAGVLTAGLALDSGSYVAPCVFVVVCLSAVLSESSFSSPGQGARVSTQVESAREEGRRGRSLSDIGLEFGLTKREIEIADLMAKGRSLPYISESIGVTLGTVQTHARHIYTKLGIHSRQELIDMTEQSR